MMFALITIEKHAVRTVDGRNRLAAAICISQKSGDEWHYQVVQPVDNPVRNEVLYEAGGSRAWCLAEVDRFSKDGLLPFERRSNS